MRSQPVSPFRRAQKNAPDRRLSKSSAAPAGHFPGCRSNQESSRLRWRDDTQLLTAQGSTANQLQLRREVFAPQLLYFVIGLLRLAKISRLKLRLGEIVVTNNILVVALDRF